MGKSEEASASEADHDNEQSDDAADVLPKVKKSVTIVDEPEHAEDGQDMTLEGTPEENAAATKIQGLYRMRDAKKKAKEKKDEMMSAQESGVSKTASKKKSMKSDKKNSNMQKILEADKKREEENARKAEEIARIRAEAKKRQELIGSYLNE